MGGRSRTPRSSGDERYTLPGLAVGPPSRRLTRVSGHSPTITFLSGLLRNVNYVGFNGSGHVISGGWAQRTGEGGCNICNDRRTAASRAIKSRPRHGSQFSFTFPPFNESRCLYGGDHGLDKYVVKHWFAGIGAA